MARLGTCPWPAIKVKSAKRHGTIYHRQMIKTRRQDRDRKESCPGALGVGRGTEGSLWFKTNFHINFDLAFAG